MAGKKTGEDMAIDSIKKKKKCKTNKQNSRASMSYGTTSTDKAHNCNWSPRK